MRSWLRLAVILGLSFILAIGILKNVPKGSKVLQLPENTSDDSSQAGDSKDLKIIDWRILRGLNFQAGTTTQELKALDGKEIRIPGFMVPLDDYQSQVTEFLLVPSPQACIHVPPPPPNQMIYVRMKAKAESKVAFGAIWVQGELKLSKVESPYGSVSFELVGKSLKPYIFERPKNL